MDTAELDRMAQAELERQGIVLPAPFVPQDPHEPPRTIASRSKTIAQWALLVILVAGDVFMAVTLL
jgi:hypothetical protein